MSALIDLMDSWLSRHRPETGMDPDEFIMFREAQIIMGVESPLAESEPCIQLPAPCFELEPEMVIEPVVEPKEETRYSFKQILRERQAQKSENKEIEETREPLKIDWKYARKNAYLINR